MRVKPKGRFIVLEHLDGAGGTTQAKLLSSYLKERGIAAVFTSEPTSSDAGMQIRSILKEGEHTEHLPYLYIADRVIHNKWISEYLAKGIWVICDRYWYSQAAYQGMDWVQANLSFIQPDLALFLDVPVEECLKRIVSRGKTVDVLENKSTLEHCREVFTTLEAKSYLKFIDGNGSIEEVQNHIQEAVQGLLPGKTRE